MLSAENAENERKTIPPGIVISLISVDANAYSSIRCSLESGSKVTDESDLQPENELAEIISPDAGR
jgi:hypothetical protein